MKKRSLLHLEVKVQQPVNGAREEAQFRWVEFCFFEDGGGQTHAYTEQAATPYDFKHNRDCLVCSPQDHLTQNEASKTLQTLKALDTNSQFNSQ